jgi:hypothetical protein
LWQPSRAAQPLSEAAGSRAERLYLFRDFSLLSDTADSDEENPLRLLFAKRKMAALMRRPRDDGAGLA